MNYTKIDNNSVFFRLLETDEWKSISEIQGNDIIILLEKCLEDESFKMVEYDSDSIRNEAHNIIYKSIYTKIQEILLDKKNILDENSQRYKKIIEKYSE